jgi:hypothetical protein
MNLYFFKFFNITRGGTTWMVRAPDEETAWTDLGKYMGCPNKVKKLYVLVKTIQHDNHHHGFLAEIRPETLTEVKELPDPLDFISKNF